MYPEPEAIDYFFLIAFGVILIWGGALNLYDRWRDRQKRERVERFTHSPTADRLRPKP